MQGIAAITANNGWAMAIAGASIVMAGLAILSFVISQLHRIISIMERKEKKTAAPKPVNIAPAPDLGTAEIDILGDLPAAARIYHALTLDLGDAFPLAMLYRIFQKENVAHPHITIRALREAGFLVSAGDGNYCWKNI